MDVSYFLVTQFEPSRSMEGIAEEFVYQTELVRDAGFYSLFVGEHHATDDNYFLNEAVIAYLADHVGDMKLGTGMCLLPYHNPVRMAEYGATLDHLTGGQFRFGVAQGYRPEEFEAFGIDRSEALARFVEGVQVIKRLWTEERVSYEGKVYSFEDVTINPQPVQDPRPEIITGASNESSIRRAAKLTDGWMGAHVPFGVATEQVAAFRDAAEAVDGDRRVGFGREVFVAETTEAAEAAVKAPLMEKYGSYSDWGQDDAIESDDFDSPWDKLRHERFLVGSPAEVVSDIERYTEAMDLDSLFVRTQFPGCDPDDVHRSLELFGDEVVPELG